MVKGKYNHHPHHYNNSRHRQFNPKSNSGGLSFHRTDEPSSTTSAYSSGKDSREDFLKTDKHTSNTIREHEFPAVAPSWDKRVDPPVVSHVGATRIGVMQSNALCQHQLGNTEEEEEEEDANTNRNRNPQQSHHRNAHPATYNNSSNQWKEYPVQVQPVGFRHHHINTNENTNTNIWSSRKSSIQNNYHDKTDSYSSSAFSMDACSWNSYMGQQQQQQQRRHYDFLKSNNMNIRDISRSMNRLNLSSTGNSIQGDRKAMMTGSSVISGNSYGSHTTLPGIVGVSSGESSLTHGQRHHQSNYSSIQQQDGYGYGYNNSIVNHQIGGQPYYPSQYPTTHQQNLPQQHANEWNNPFHFRPIQDRINPPGFTHLNQSMNSQETPSSRMSKQHMNDNGHGSNTRVPPYGGKNKRRYTERNKRRKPDEENNWSSRKGNRVDTHLIDNDRERLIPSSSHYHRNPIYDCDDDRTSASAKDDASSMAGSDAIRMIMNPQGTEPSSSITSYSTSSTSALVANRLPLEHLADDSGSWVDSSLALSSSVVAASATASRLSEQLILPSIKDIEVSSIEETTADDELCDKNGIDNDEDEEASIFRGKESSIDNTTMGSTNSKKRDWLLRMNRRLADVPVGELDPSVTPVSAIMNAWAKTKSSHGASMVEAWLNRAQEEFDVGNTRIVPTNKMYTMACDAWAKSDEGVSAAHRAEMILHHMNKRYQSTGAENLRPTTGIFNAVINAWARSKEKIAPSRAEQILKWMDKLHKTNPSIRPDKYTFNTVIHAYAKAGGIGAAKKAQKLLVSMHFMYKNGNHLAKPDTITYNVVINSLAKSGGKDAAKEAEKLLGKMHKLYEEGDFHVKPNVVTYGAVIDAYAKSGEKYAAARADGLLARMIHLNQMDPVENSDLQPNTYVFNTVINAHAKSKEHDAASKAEEMLLAMNKLHLQGLPNLKPDAFTYTAVIDAWAKSGYRGAATRADQLLDKMESKYLAGDMDLKPNTFTYNAVINALAKSGEPSAAARAERVLHNMVNRHRHGASEDVKPTTINFNSVLDAWAKSGGGRKAAERAEEILEWMDRLYKSGNCNVRPDTITFNAVLDAWARSGDRMAAHRAEQILDHMDELYRTGNHGVKPDTYTYNTLINAHAKSSEKGSAARAEHVLQVMKQRYVDGDDDFKPNTRTHTSVIDAIAKSGEKGAARRAEQILNSMIAIFEEAGDFDSKPNVHTANAVCNACAFTKRDEDRSDALQIAFRVYDWLAAQPKMEPDAYTYTILLSVCSNLLPREDRSSRFSHAKSFFDKCCESGYVNDYVLRKLRQTVSDQEYLTLVEYQGDSLPQSWTRKVGHKHSRFQNSGAVANSRSKQSGRSWQKKRGNYNK